MEFFLLRRRERRRLSWLFISFCLKAKRLFRLQKIPFPIIPKISHSFYVVYSPFADIFSMPTYNMKQYYRLLVIIEESFKLDALLNCVCVLHNKSERTKVVIWILPLQQLQYYFLASLPKEFWRRVPYNRKRWREVSFIITRPSQLAAFQVPKTEGILQ